MARKPRDPIDQIFTHALTLMGSGANDNVELPLTQKIRLDSTPHFLYPTPQEPPPPTNRVTNA